MSWISMHFASRLSCLPPGYKTKMSKPGPLEVLWVHCEGSCSHLSKEHIMKISCLFPTP